MVCPRQQLEFGITVDVGSANDNDTSTVSPATPENPQSPQPRDQASDREVIIDPNLIGWPYIPTPEAPVKAPITLALPSREVSQISLPEITLPTFDGSPAQWMYFIEFFRAVVFTQPIAPVIKCTHLFNQLRGAAARAVGGFYPSETTFKIALRILEKRFGNPEFIRLDCYNKIIRMTPLTSTSTLQEIRTHTNEIEDILRLLETLGDNIEHPFVIFQVERLLTEEILDEIFKLYGFGHNLAATRATIQDYLKRKEHIQILKSRKQPEDEVQPDNVVPVAMQQIVRRPWRPHARSRNYYRRR